MNEMTSSKTVLQAISAYDYPPVTYDFALQREVYFPAMLKLDDHLHRLLHSGDVRTVKDGLSGVLYWGHYRTGIRDHRVKRFRAMVTRNQLEQCIRTFNTLDGTSLSRLQGMGLPEFRYI